MPPISRGPARARELAGRVLVTLGSLVLAASGALHFFVLYSGLSAALRAANLAPPLANGLREVFLLVGCDWILFAAIALSVTWRAMPARRWLLLLCGAGVLAQTAITLRLAGLFAGSEMIGAAALSLLAGAMALPSPGGPG